MILCLDGEALVGGVERGSLRDCPRLEDAVAFEPEVEMQARRGMLLDDEEQRPCACLAHRSGWLRGGVERALGGILAELAFAHGACSGSPWQDGFSGCRNRSALIPGSLRAGKFLRAECTLPPCCGTGLLSLSCSCW